MVCTCARDFGVMIRLFLPLFLLCELSHVCMGRLIEYVAFMWNSSSSGWSGGAMGWVIF